MNWEVGEPGDIGKKCSVPSKIKVTNIALTETYAENAPGTGKNRFRFLPIKQINSSKAEHFSYQERNKKEQIMVLVNDLIVSKSTETSNVKHRVQPRKTFGRSSKFF